MTALATFQRVIINTTAVDFTVVDNFCPLIDFYDPFSDFDRIRRLKITLDGVAVDAKGVSHLFTLTGFFQHVETGLYETKIRLLGKSRQNKMSGLTVKDFSQDTDELLKVFEQYLDSFQNIEIGDTGQIVDTYELGLMLEERIFTITQQEKRDAIKHDPFFEYISIGETKCQRMKINQD